MEKSANLKDAERELQKTFEKEKMNDNYIINSNNAEEDYIDKLVNDLK